MKFSVHTGLRSVTVEWTDGPASDDVQRVASRAFAGCYRGGFIDLAYYYQDEIAFPVLVETHQVLCTQHISTDLRDMVTSVTDPGEWEHERAGYPYLTPDQMAYRIVRTPTRFPRSAFAAGLITEREYLLALGSSQVR